MPLRKRIVGHCVVRKSLMRRSSSEDVGRDGDDDIFNGDDRRFVLATLRIANKESVAVAARRGGDDDRQHRDDNGGSTCNSDSRTAAAVVALVVVVRIMVAAPREMSDEFRCCRKLFHSLFKSLNFGSFKDLTKTRI
jgi:hypothetical protein